MGNPEGKSAAVSFTVDTTPPALTLAPIASPTNNTEPSFGGAAGNAPGDTESVTLRIYPAKAPPAVRSPR